MGWKRFAVGDVASWKARIVQLLSDGVARTFNRIAVEIADATADTLFQKDPDEALWTLLKEEQIEHTLEVPILWRLRKADAASETKPGDAKA